MLGNERRGGEESPLFLLRQWKKKERAILYAFQTPSTVSFRSSRDSSSAFSFHKLVRLDSDPMESSIHRGTISISPGSSQRSAFRFPPPSSSPHRWGEGGGLGSFKRSIEPPGSHRLLVSCLLACLPIFGIDSRLLVRSFVHGLVGDEFVWWLREGSKFTETRLLLLLSLRPMWGENIVEAHCWQFERRSGNRRKSFCEFFCCFLVSLFHFFLLDMYIVHVFFFFYKGIQRVLIKIGLDSFIGRVMIRWI